MFFPTCGSNMRLWKSESVKDKLRWWRKREARRTMQRHTEPQVRFVVYLKQPRVAGNNVFDVRHNAESAVSSN